MGDGGFPDRAGIAGQGAYHGAAFAADRKNRGGGCCACGKAFQITDGVSFAGKGADAGCGLKKRSRAKRKTVCGIISFPERGLESRWRRCWCREGRITCFGREGRARKSAFRRERRILSSISCFSRNGAMPLRALRKMAHLPMPLPMATGRFIILPVRINSRKI